MTKGKDRSIIDLESVVSTMTVHTKPLALYSELNIQLNHLFQQTPSLTIKCATKPVDLSFEASATTFIFPQ